MSKQQAKAEMAQEESGSQQQLPPSGSQAALRVLVVGGAGHVGGIIRPALEEAHHVRHLDLNPVPGAEDRTFIGSVTDEAAVCDAVVDVDAVVYLAMGIEYGESEENQRPGFPDHVQRNFDVNAQGVYRVLRRALDVGVRRFVYASTLSVYGRFNRPRRVDESHEPNAWQAYGLTKRLGERICEMGGASHPDATIVGLRLVHPLNAQQYADRQALLDAGLSPSPPRRPNQRPRGGAGQGGKRKRMMTLWSTAALAPNDLRRLFVAALALEKPGVHFVQTSGDLAGKICPNDGARTLLGWEPRGD